MNEKLIKRLKKSISKKFENDIRDSIIDKIYGKSKEDIKELKEKLYNEMVEELFGEKKESNEQQKDDFYKYRGFEFDVNRMSELVTGNKKQKSEDIINNRLIKEEVTMNDLITGIDKQPSTTTNISKKEWIEQMNPNVSTESKKFKNIEKVMNGYNKEEINKIINLQPPLPQQTQQPLTSIYRKVEKNQHQTFQPISTNNDFKNIGIITKSKKEELSFFIGKLKDGVSKLSKIEKYINYRKKEGNIYCFSFNKKNIINKFDLSFDFNLNMYTYGVVINKFNFEIDKFKFDKSFFDIIDIVDVLELVGFNLKKSINEINGINEIDINRLKQHTKKKKTSIRLNTKIENIIDDKSIIKILNNNDISNYKDLKKFENDFTTIKGVGIKTADKINKYIKM